MIIIIGFAQSMLSSSLTHSHSQQSLCLQKYFTLFTILKSHVAHNKFTVFIFVCSHRKKETTNRVTTQGRERQHAKSEETEESMLREYVALQIGCWVGSKTFFDDK